MLLKVKVSAVKSKTKDKEVDYFKQFDVVIATNCDKEELLRINSICRSVIVDIEQC